MKTLSQMVAEAHGDAQPEYLKHTLIGRDEIGRFAHALRNEAIDEAIHTLEADGDFAGAALLQRKLKGTA